MAVPVALVVERLGEVPGRGREAIVKVGWELLSLLLVAPRGGRVSVVSAAWFQSSQMLLVVYQCTAISVLHAIDRVMCKALASSRRTCPPHMLYPGLDHHQAGVHTIPFPGPHCRIRSTHQQIYTRNRSSQLA
jgi:hypothetical protein